MKTKLEQMAKAVSEIDGGCCSYIKSFLDDIDKQDAMFIADWINKNRPLYGGSEKLILDSKGEWTTV